MQLLHWTSPNIIVEIGTCLGNMTANFCHYSKDDAQVYTIDICEEMGIAIPEEQRASGELLARSKVGQFINYYGDGHKARQIFCDSMEFDWSRIPRPDFVYIDGNHDYAYVRHDTRQAFRHLNDAGLIVWHDYSNTQGATEAINEFSNRVPGVMHVENTWVAFCIVDWQCLA